MRSGLPGDGGLHRPSNPTNSLGHGAPSTAPMSCFIASEARLNAVRDRSPDHRTRLPHLADTCKVTDDAASPAPPLRDAQDPSSDDGQHNLANLSRTSTPLLVGLSAPESALSCFSSRPSSLADPSVDHRLSFLHDNPSYPATPVTGEAFDESAIPQLIMPSLTVPRRRQFSEAGRLLGNIKIMVAGQTGTGKTSLIKTLAQRCEHIVHTDPIESTNGAAVAEVYASTRPHPYWTAGSDISSQLGSKWLPPSGGMLDRNVCFVDGAGCRSDGSSETSPCLAYIESRLLSLTRKPLDDADLFAFVHAGGGPIVDVVLYLISSDGINTADVEFIREAQTMCNIIPVLPRIDELSAREVEDLRLNVELALENEDLDCFTFSEPGPTRGPSPVYSISTSVEDDNDIMDASLLMNSSYLPPLAPSELSDLSSRLFSLDGMAQLRASAASKCLGWRHRHSQMLLASRWQRHGRPQGQSLTGPWRLTPRASSQGWGRIELNNWASTLQHSLRTENLYQLLTSTSERPRGGKVDERRLVPASTGGGRHAARQRHRQQQERRIHQDPLGLLELGGKLWQSCIFALEVASGVGAVGYIVSRAVPGSWASTTSCATIGCLDDGIGWKATRLHVQLLG